MVVALAYAVMDRSKKWLIALFAVIMVCLLYTSIGYQRKAELTYTNAFHSGFSVQMTTRLRKDESSHLIPFVKHDDHEISLKRQWRNKWKRIKQQLS